MAGRPRAATRIALGLAAWSFLAPGAPVIAQNRGDAETVAELKAALAELRRRLAEEPQPPSAAELQVARRQIERLTEAMVGLRRERDGLRGELVIARAERDRLRAVAAERQQRLAVTEATVADLQRELAAVTAERTPAALVAAEPVSHSETLAGSAFAPGSAALRGDAAARLDAIVVWLRNQPAGRVVIEGHTDARGDEEANRRLSLARAEAVRDGLAALGVTPARIVVLGRGEDEPVADNATAEGRAANRRVVVTLEP